MTKRNAVNLVAVLAVLFLVSACALPKKTGTLDNIKSKLNCVTYEDGMRWKLVKETFDEPDITPLPSGESLSQNTRGFDDMIVLFYTELKTVFVDGKRRKQEVITKVEICQEK